MQKCAACQASAQLAAAALAPRQPARCRQPCAKPARHNADEDPTLASMDSEALPASFCIIEDRNTVQNFAKLQLDEIKSSIQARRNRIFLLMEEVRRLRIQERVKGGSSNVHLTGQLPHTSTDDDKFSSVLPFLPKLDETTLTHYFKYYYGVVLAIILFGGLVAPILEVKMGLGGASYGEFIQAVRLPPQLADVDPIVASFCGGAVGVLSALLAVEVKNIEQQQRSRCIYCAGSGYLECGACHGDGCGECSGTGRVMCTSCLCTGKKLATEHDIRADPFQ